MSNVFVAHATDDSISVPPARRPAAPRGYLLLNIGGWLLFGAGMMIASLPGTPLTFLLAITPVHILIGFLLSLMLGFVLDRLGVGPTSFARALAIIFVGSLIAGLLSTIAFNVYRHYGAAAVHSLIIGAPSPFNSRRLFPFSGIVTTTLPLLALSLARLGLQYNTALLHQREQALRAESAARDAQLRMLAYQLNPHFLFNTLNSIRALINEDRERARDMVTSLSGYLRYALVERPLHTAMLEEEVESVRGYLAIEQVRFEERLDVRMEIDPATLRCEVPAFLLNPLVENAVRHGNAGTAEAPLVVRVEARLVQPDRLRLVVENTGRWAHDKTNALAANAVLANAAAAASAPSARMRDNELPGGVGLANVRARLAALHPADHRIDIEELDGRVRVVVDLPARYRSVST